MTFVVEPDPDDPADVIGDEPVWHDGEVVGWVTSGGYGHHVRRVDRAGLRARGARRRPTARAAAASRSRSSAGAGRRGSSPSRCSTRRVSGCASDRRPVAGGRRRPDRRRRAADRVPSRRLGRHRDRPGGRGAGSRRHACAWPATAATASRRSTASPTSGPARSAARPGTVVGRHPADGKPPLPSSTPRPDLGVADRRGGRRSARPTPTSRSIGGGRRPRRRCRTAARWSSMRATAIEVVGIYPGPTIVAREPGGMLHLAGRRDRRRDRRRRAPAGLPGQRARRDRHAAARPSGSGRPGVDLGAGSVTRRPRARPVRGRRPVGSRRSSPAAPTASETPQPAATPPSSTSAASPRDVLARMAGGRRACAPSGSAADDHPLPPAPTAPASSARAWARPSTTSTRRGTTATPSSSCSSARRWAGLGPCQGGACLPHVRAFIAARTGDGPGAVHRPPGRPPDHPRRGRRRRDDRCLPADAAPRRAPRARRADGPVRRLVAAVALRRRRRRSTGRSARACRSATCRRSASSSSAGRTSSRRSSGSTRATSRTSSRAARATRCCSTSAAT